MRSKFVALLFFGSGFAALVYEVVWFQLLRLVIGASSLSLGILLASFMGGMCLGSLCLPLVVPARLHPLRVYAALELALGGIGCSLPWWLPRVSDWYQQHAADSLTGITARAVVAGVALIPPAMLMGATLPAVARWVKDNPKGLSQLGIFYGANLAGAVLGCLAAGFVLLPRTDVVFASNVAAVINVTVAALAILLAYSSAYQPAEDLANPPASADGYLSQRFGVVAALSGFAALGAEVVWTRLLSLLFGSTVYTFAIILAVFLSGLGIGSTLAAGWIRWSRHPLRWLVVAQLAIVFLVPYANFMITGRLPYYARPVVSTTSDTYAVFAHDAWRAAAAILPAAIIWGASFPLTLAAAGGGQGDTGRLVGRMYAANTLGAVLGSLVTSGFLIPFFGSQRTQQVLVLVSGMAALLAIGAARSFRAVGNADEDHPSWAYKTKHGADLVFHWLAGRRGRAFVGLLTVVGLFCVSAPPKGFYGRSLEPYSWRYGGTDDIFVREGRSTTVAVQKLKFIDIRYLCVGGKIEASNMPKDLRTELMLGHLPALLHPSARKTLTVGMGTGTTAGSFVLYPEVEHIAICEIEPVVREAAKNYFSKENNAVVDDRRTHFHFDDARHYLAATNERFDVITSDPINSWIRGASALYSREYYELCKEHLKPGGIMVQWIPLYEKDLATAKCELATFLGVFPSATLWTSWTSREGDDERHDLIAIGQAEAASIDLAELERAIHSNAGVKAALGQVNLGTIPELMGQFVCRGEDLQPWLLDAELNEELSLRLEYLAGLSLWMQSHTEIFQEIATYRSYPADLLENDAAYKDEIARRLKVPTPAE
jgi:spermidine synthase